MQRLLCGISENVVEYCSGCSDVVLSWWIIAYVTFYDSRNGECLFMGLSFQQSGWCYVTTAEISDKRFYRWRIYDLCLLDLVDSLNDPHVVRDPGEQVIHEALHLEQHLLLNVGLHFLQQLLRVGVYEQVQSRLWKPKQIVNPELWLFGLVLCPPPTN